ncbi:MAG: RNA 2',3'-cyclic phosphodiesterase [Nocardioidaceae bacterium]
MRVFAAVVPPQEALDHLAHTLGPFSEAYPDLGWLPQESWHITLSYFGNISLPDLKRLATAMKSVAESRPPDIGWLEGAAGLPAEATANSLCINVGSQSDGLADLSSAVVRSVQGFGWLLDRRSFKSILPVAQPASSADVRDVVSRLSTYSGSAWAVDAITVVQARASTDGGATTYEVLDRHLIPED